MMSTLLQTWPQFAIVSAVIVVAGYYLSRYCVLLQRKPGCWARGPV